MVAYTLIGIFLLFPMIFFFVLRGLFSILYLLVAEKWRKLVEKEMWSLFQLNSCPGLNWVESFVVWCFKY